MMKIARISIPLLVIVGLLGCAAREKTAINVQPTTEELPDLAVAKPRTHQMDVAVEGRPGTPIEPLTPDFKEPELTPEERAALGRDEPTYEPLLYNLPGRAPGSTVAFEYTMPRVAVYGVGAAQSGVTAWAPRVIAWGDADASIGLSTTTPPTGHAGEVRGPIGGVGMSDSLKVGYGMPVERSRVDPLP